MPIRYFAANKAKDLCLIPIGTHILNKSVLILGMHRSGTSALAGLLNIAGLYLAENLTPGREDNAKGFFEHEEIWRIHQILLTNLCRDWDDTRALPDGWQQERATTKAISDLAAIAERDFRGSALWGVKDPRMSRLFDVWPRVIREMGVELRVVLALRHPIEIARSLAHRNGIDPAHGLALWLRYSIDAERATRPWPRVVQHYPDLLTDWSRALDRIDGALGLGLPPRSPELDKKIEDFLDIGLHHQKIAEDTFVWENSDLVSRWCARAYEAMSATETDGNAQVAMDAIAAEFNAWEREAAPICAQVSYYLGQRQKRDDSVLWLEGERDRLIEHARRALLEQEAARGRQSETIRSLEESHALLLDLHNREAAEHKAAHGLQSETIRSLEEKLARLTEERDNEIVRHEAMRASQLETIQLLEHERTGLIAKAREDILRIHQTESSLLLADRRIDEFNRQLADMSLLVDRIYRSKSWRVMAPMRRVVSFLRDMRARSTPALVEGSRQPAPAQPAPAPADISRLADAPPDRSETSALNPTTEFAASVAVSRRPSILMVTPDIHGPIRNGGIGTAFAALAIWFVRWGYEVTLLYALGDFTESEPVDHWRKYYADLGVKLIALTPDEHGDMPPLQGSYCGQAAWKVHAWLKTHEQLFSLVIFPEWMGLAYYVLLSKGQGLAYRDLTIAVNAHSPENWALDGNRALPDSTDMLEREFMERETVRRADWLISPSEYMMTWMRDHQWRIPTRSLVIQNLLTESSCSGASNSDDSRIHELVFFGRLELRKGLKLFCDAVDRLSTEQRDRVSRIVFMGKSSMVEGQESSKYIRSRSGSWRVTVDIITNRNRDEAIDYLTKPGVLAIIASLSENSPYTVLECLHHRICFMATAVGGIPELLHPDDRGEALFDPNPASLHQGISKILERGAHPARMAQPQDLVQHSWRAWLEKAGRVEPPVSAAIAAALAKVQPMITVCLVHYDRPIFLSQALDSLRGQTYPNFEVVLVDDGSPSEAAREFLDALEPEFELRGWTIIRQSNRYLGAARNRAAQAARGEYFLFMDDDNVAMPQELEVFANAAVHGGADILTCAAHIFRGDLTPSHPNELWLPLGGAAGAGLYRNVFGDANALWRRDAFLQTGGYTTDHGLGHEDWELFAEAVLAGLRLEVVPEPLFWYRIHSGSMLRNGDIWADHARSVRPYVRRDPHGLGLASAYAVCLLQSRIATMGSPTARATPLRGWSRLSNAVHLASDPDNVVRFARAFRNQGLRHAVLKSVARSRY